MEAVLRGLCSRLVDHPSLVDSAWGFPSQVLDWVLDDYLQVVFTAEHNRTAGVQSVTSTSNVDETNSATICQDVSSILKHLNSRQAASASYSLVTTSSDPLGVAAAPPPL